MLFADHFVTLPPHATSEAFRTLLSELQPGLTELNLRPAIDTPELRAITPEWPARVSDHVLLVADRGLERVAAEAGATLIGYRTLRDAMQAS